MFFVIREMILVLHIYIDEATVIFTGQCSEILVFEQQIFVIFLYSYKMGKCFENEKIVIPNFRPNPAHFIMQNRTQIKMTFSR
jgi:hypothetical protein